MTYPTKIHPFRSRGPGFAMKNWRGKPQLLPVRKGRVFDLAPKLPHFWMTSAVAAPAADRNDNDLPP